MGNQSFSAQFREVCSEFSIIFWIATGPEVRCRATVHLGLHPGVRGPVPEWVLWLFLLWVIDCFVEQELLLSGSWDGSSTRQSNNSQSWSLSCSWSVVSWIVA